MVPQHLLQTNHVAVLADSKRQSPRYHENSHVAERDDDQVHDKAQDDCHGNVREVASASSAPVYRARGQEGFRDVLTPSEQWQRCPDSSLQPAGQQGRLGTLWPQEMILEMKQEERNE